MSHQVDHVKMVARNDFGVSQQSTTANRRGNVQVLCNGCHFWKTKIDNKRDSPGVEDVAIMCIACGYGKMLGTVNVLV